jgi:hypothetical protein
MSIVLVGSTSGSVTLQEPAVAGTTVLDLPATSGTVLVGGTQNIPKSALPTGSVLQVVQATKTDAFSTTSNSFVDITGLSASITPTSATSKILILSTVSAAGNNATCGYYLKLLRGSTDIFIGDAAGSRVRVTGSNINSDNNFFNTNGFTFLDSPATTSSTTYKFQIATSFGTSTIGVNRSVNDTDNANTGRGPSSIVLMEIAA